MLGKAQEVAIIIHRCVSGLLNIKMTQKPGALVNDAVSKTRTLPGVVDTTPGRAYVHKGSHELVF